MAARYLDIKLTEISVDTNAGPAILLDNNPLGKIPTLITDDGLSVFDSRGINHYFGRMEGKRLYPGSQAKRTKADVLEALCDGTCDCLLSIIYERRFRTEERCSSLGSTASGQKPSERLPTSTRTRRRSVAS